jgi:plasmid stabilization system protein ParE
LAYEVKTSEKAEEDVRQIYRLIRADSATAADHWFLGIYDRIESLRTFPLRCPLAPESSDQPEVIRQQLFGRYRILFAVRGKQVLVLHIRHGARDRAGSDDIYPEELTI